MDKAESLCKVCGDKASGKHYGVPSCDGCRGFFKRSIRRGLAYHCKESGNCVVDVTRRNQCQSCRFRKCLAVNMKRDAVQHERAPRAAANSGLICGRRGAPSSAGILFPPGYASMPGGAPFTLDMPYHLAYPQPPITFAGLPFNLFGYSSTFHRPSTEPYMRLPHLKRDETKTECNLSSNSEEEVTSSEEASDHSRLETKFSSLNLPLTHGPEVVYESAAKLLFLTVKWTKSIPSFLELSFHDQSLLLEESWSDLFVLNAAEWLLPIDEEYLLNQRGHGLRKEVLAKEIQRLKEIISKFIAMRVDHTEYSCLKALTLFKPEMTDLEARTRVELLQDQAHCMLQEHVSTPEVPKSRFGKLLLLLPNVHSLCKDLLEEMLFRKTIGDISVARVLSDMLKSH